MWKYQVLDFCEVIQFQDAERKPCLRILRYHSDLGFWKRSPSILLGKPVSELCERILSHEWEKMLSQDSGTKSCLGFVGESWLNNWRESCFRLSEAKHFSGFWERIMSRDSGREFYLRIMWEHHIWSFWESILSQDSWRESVSGFWRQLRLEILRILGENSVSGLCERILFYDWRVSSLRIVGNNSVSGFWERIICQNSGRESRFKILQGNLVSGFWENPVSGFWRISSQDSAEFCGRISPQYYLRENSALGFW